MMMLGFGDDKYPAILFHSSQQSAGCCCSQRGCAKNTSDEELKGKKVKFNYQNSFKSGSEKLGQLLTSDTNLRKKLNKRKKNDFKTNNRWCYLSLLHFDKRLISRETGQLAAYITNEDLAGDIFGAKVDEYKVPAVNQSDKARWFVFPTLFNPHTTKNQSSPLLLKPSRSGISSSRKRSGFGIFGTLTRSSVKGQRKKKKARKEATHQDNRIEQEQLDSINENSPKRKKFASPPAKKMMMEFMRRNVTNAVVGFFTPNKNKTKYSSGLLEHDLVVDFQEDQESAEQDLSNHEERVDLHDLMDANSMNNSGDFEQSDDISAIPFLMTMSPTATTSSNQCSPPMSARRSTSIKRMRFGIDLVGMLTGSLRKALRKKKAPRKASQDDHVVQPLIDSTSSLNKRRKNSNDHQSDPAKRSSPCSAERSAINISGIVEQIDTNVDSNPPCLLMTSSGSTSSDESSKNNDMCSRMQEFVKKRPHLHRKMESLLQEAFNKLKDHDAAILLQDNIQHDEDANTPAITSITGNKSNTVTTTTSTTGINSSEGAEDDKASGLSNLAVVNALMSERWKEGGEHKKISTIPYIDKSNKYNERSFLEFKVNRENKLPSTKQSLKKKVRDITDLASTVIKLSAGDQNEDIQNEVIENLASRNRAKNAGRGAKTNQYCLDAFDCLAIRQEAGPAVSNRQILRILNAIARLKGKNPRDLRPACLRQKMSEIEQASCLLPLYTSKIVEIDGKSNKPRVFWRITKIPRLIEMLNISAHADGKYAASNKWSNLDGVLLLYRGTDRGGGDNQDVLRLGNREDGNSGRYCVTVSSLEGGAETYNNMKQTCFHPDSNQTYDMIENDQLHMLTISFSGAFESVLLGFSLPTRSEENISSPHELNIRFDSIKYSFAEFDSMQQYAFADEQQSDETVVIVDSGCSERVKPDTIALSPNMISREGNQHLVLHLTAKMIKKRQEESSAVIGIEIYHDKECLYRLKFASEIVQFKEEATTIMCEKMKIMYTNDAKMNNTIFGLSTCGVKYGCPYCIIPTAETFIPRWLYDYALNSMSNSWDEEKFGRNPILNMNVAEPELRCGKYSHAESVKKYERLCGKNVEVSQATSKSVAQLDAEEESKSVTKPPLRSLKNPLLQAPPDSLHLFEGIFNHLIEDAVNKLKAAETDPADPTTPPSNTSNNNVEAMKILVKNSMDRISKSASFKAEKKSMTKLALEIRKLKSKKKESQENLNSSRIEEGTNEYVEERLKLDAIQEQIDAKEDEKKEYFSSSLGIGNRVLKGLKSLKHLLDGKGE